MSLEKKIIGTRGEQIASDYLLKKGYKIIARNFRIRYGELDIICIKDNVLIFVEVKTRTDAQYGTPEEAVTPRKLREIILTSQFYIAGHKGLPERQRIDVIAIVCDAGGKVSSLKHLENVSQ